MVSWLVTTAIGLAIAVLGAFIATIGKTTSYDFSSIGWLIGLAGIAIFVLGILTKTKSLKI